MRKRWAFSLLLFAQCSWCAAPKPTPFEEPEDRDAAPHAAEVPPRCSSQSTIALPGTFEIGRVISTASRVVIGARRGARSGVLDTDGLTVHFTEVADAVGDVPPPVPLAVGERIMTVEYEGTPRHLVVRDSQKVMAELPREPPDESLAYDAAALSDGAILTAWDAPADEGSAIYAAVIRGGVVSESTRLSPRDVDADTPRVVPFGPNIVATWIAHRPIPEGDAKAPEQVEGPGQALDHTWVEMLAFDPTLHPTSPLRHLTPDGGRIGSFDVQAELSPPGITLLARDALELQAGQGGKLLLVGVHGLEVDAPVVLAERVGRGVPLYKPPILLYADAENRGRAILATHRDSAETASLEPVLDAARPLAFVPSSGSDVIVAPEGGTELRVVRCTALP